MGLCWSSVVVKALRYWSGGPGINSRWCHCEFFPWLHTPDVTMCPGVDPSPENEYQGFLLGKRRPVRMADDLPPS